MPRPLLKRLVIAATFCVFFSGLVVAVTVSMALRNRAPETALALWPLNGEARGQLAGRALIAGDVPRSLRLAKGAVRQVPGDAISLRVLGMSEQVAGQTKRGEQIMRLATTASRRDLLTNIWFIEHYVALGNVKDAVRYYDYTLKTSAEAEQLLFPVLTSAMTSPEIASAVKDKLVLRPVWFKSFLQYAFSSGAADEQLVPLVLDLARDPQGISLDLQKQYVQRLAERGNLAGLSVLARGLGHPLVRGAASLGGMGNLAPVDWRLLSGPGLSTYPNDKSGLSFVTVNQNVAIADRLLNLAPGEYGIRQNVGFEADAAGVGVRWTVTCVSNNLALPVSVRSDISQFAVPRSGCEYQKLTLSIVSNDFSEDNELSGSVSDMRLEPIS